MRLHGHCRALTLIELLVVAIIAGLNALLFSSVEATRHVFQIVMGPNTRSWESFTAPRAIMPPSRRNPGGVNLLLGGGSVRFVMDTINVPTWRALGTIDGGEAIRTDSF